MKTNISERVLHPVSGGLMLLLIVIGVPVLDALGIWCFVRAGGAPLPVLGQALVILGSVVLLVMAAGLKIVRPNEARVFTLFGKYYGTVKESGFFWVNPFAVSFSPAYNQAQKEAAEAKKKLASEGKTQSISVGVGKCISLKTQTLDNRRQKVNDVLGNPIIIGAVVIWHVSDPTRAVFSVENYVEFLNIQTDSTIRNIARLYPYDVFDDEDDDDGVKEKTLRGSAIEIADTMRDELQKRVADAGLEIEDVRITHLAYSEEIAAAMLQRQQAVAIIAARKKIVDGAVGMVKMAIERLNEDEVVELDEERKAAMVSNLLVVLCGNKDAQPIVNSGSIY